MHIQIKGQGIHEYRQNGILSEISQLIRISEIAQGLLIELQIKRIKEDV